MAAFVSVGGRAGEVYAMMLREAIESGSAGVTSAARSALWKIENPSKKTRVTKLTERELVQLVSALGSYAEDFYWAPQTERPQVGEGRRRPVYHVPTAYPGKEQQEELEEYERWRTSER